MGWGWGVDDDAVACKADVPRKDDRALHAKAAAGAQRGRAVGGEGAKPLERAVQRVEAHERRYATTHGAQHAPGSGPGSGPGSSSGSGSSLGSGSGSGPGLDSGSGSGSGSGLGSGSGSGAGSGSGSGAGSGLRGRRLVATQLREWPPLILAVVLVAPVPHLERVRYGRQGSARRGEVRRSEARRGEAR